MDQDPSVSSYSHWGDGLSEGLASVSLGKSPRASSRELKDQKQMFPSTAGRVVQTSLPLASGKDSGWGSLPSSHPGEHRLFTSQNAKESSRLKVWSPNISSLPAPLSGDEGVRNLFFSGLPGLEATDDTALGEQSYQPYDESHAKKSWDAAHRSEGMGEHMLPGTAAADTQFSFLSDSAPLEAPATADSGSAGSASASFLGIGGYGTMQNELPHNEAKTASEEKFLPSYDLDLQPMHGSGLNYNAPEFVTRSTFPSYRSNNKTGTTSGASTGHPGYEPQPQSTVRHPSPVTAPAKRLNQRKASDGLESLGGDSKKAEDKYGSTVFPPNAFFSGHSQPSGSSYSLYDTNKMLQYQQLAAAQAAQRMVLSSNFAAAAAAAGMNVGMGWGLGMIPGVGVGVVPTAIPLPNGGPSSKSHSYDQFGGEASFNKGNFGDGGPAVTPSPGADYLWQRYYQMSQKYHAEEGEKQKSDSQTGSLSFLDRDSGRSMRNTGSDFGEGVQRVDGMPPKRKNKQVLPIATGKGPTEMGAVDMQSGLPAGLSGVYGDSKLMKSSSGGGRSNMAEAMIANVELAENENLIEVEFKRLRREVFVGTNAFKLGELVKVEADRGEDLGRIVNISKDMSTVNYSSLSPAISKNGGKDSKSLRRVLRLATDDEVKRAIRKAEEEAEVLEVCRSKVRQRALPMRVIDAEFQFDHHKLTFFFEADRRIDFRELVRDLFTLYKTRIWMQHVTPPNKRVSPPPPPPPPSATSMSLPPVILED